MRPLLLVGILAVSGATGCSRGGDAPAVQPGVAAGKVVEVSGEVRATRAGATRTLAAGAEVSGDDVIETAADGHVVIVLAHNNARWELNRNQRVKVGESDAWSEPTREGVATAGDEATTTAGRHGEKMAASSSTTGARPAAETERARDEASPPAAAAPVPAPEPAAQPTPPPAPPTRNERGGIAGGGDGAAAPGAGFGGQGALGAPSTGARAPARSSAPAKDMKPAPKAAKLERAAESSANDADALASSGGEHASVEQAFAPILTSMKQCVSGSAEVRLTVTVDAGVASLAYMDGTPAADVARCLERHAKTLKLASPNKDRVRFRAIVRAR